MILDPLIQLLCCFRRFLHNIGIIRKDHGCSAIWDYQIISVGGFHFKILCIRDLRTIQRYKEVFSSFRDVLCHFVSAKLDHIKVCFRLTRLFCRHYTVKKAFRSCTGCDKLQLCFILVLRSIKCFDLLFKLYTDIIRSTGPHGNDGLSVSCFLCSCISCPGAARHKRRSHCQRHDNRSNFLFIALHFQFLL